MTILQSGRPVAKLVAPDSEASHGRGLAAADRIKALRQQIMLGPDLSLRKLMDDGRM